MDECVDTQICVGRDSARQWLSRNGNEVLKESHLDGGRWLLWAKIRSDSRYKPMSSIEYGLEETVVLVESKESLLAERSKPLLSRLYRQWKGSSSDSRWVCLFYPRPLEPDTVCCLYSNAILLRFHDQIVEYRLQA